MSLPQLSPSLLTEKPALQEKYTTLQQLPEKVLQFGTGVLLRGLPDYFIHQANEQGVFNGRVVVVKSTSNGKTDAFTEQSSLYTHCIRGIENGKTVDHTFINSAVSRTLSAATEWGTILEVAAQPSIEIVISNTTEVGIQFVEDSLTATPPTSYPGKLTALLYHRFLTFKGSKDHGWVIVPTELVPDNGIKLKEIVLEQAKTHDLPSEFIDWIETANEFCSSLVDRIVPGKPAPELLEELTNARGYQDDLLIMSEPYNLWAITGDERVKNILSFASVNPGVVIEPNIDLYRELKLRLLNGTHTLAVGLCYLSGKNTVREAMEEPALEEFISNLMLQELGPAIPYDVAPEVYIPYGNQVLDRFRNPAIRHQLIDITVQYTAKMKMRNIPTLLEHYKHSNVAPAHFAKGFAAFLIFMKAVEQRDGVFYGKRGEELYPIRCDAAAYFYEKWQQAGDDVEVLVNTVTSDNNLWGADLSALPGFSSSVIAEVTAFAR